MNTEDEILKRLARLESRLCQLMLHFGVDPQERMYDTPREVVTITTKAAPKVWRPRNRSP